MIHPKLDGFLKVSLVLSFCLCFCKPVDAQLKLSVNEFREDLQFLEKQITRYYPGLYFYETKEQHDNRFNKHFSLENDSLSYVEYYSLLAHYISDFQDLHLSISIPSQKQKEPTRYFPFIVKRFGEKFYIHYNQSNDSTLVRGTEIIRIHQIQPIQLYESFTHLYGADKNNSTSKKYYAEKNFATYFQRLNPHLDSVNIQYRLPQDTLERTSQVVLLDSEKMSENLKKRYKNVYRKNFDYRMLDSSAHAAYLDITSFRENRKKLQSQFKRNLKLSFIQIEKDSIENLVIDLRGNGGGAIENVKRLYKYVALEPFKLYDSLIIKKAALRKFAPPIPGFVIKLFFKPFNDSLYYKHFKHLSIKPIKKHGYKGDLFVLTDGGSYSATTFTISLLNHYKRATFVGNTPGGANWGSFAGRFYRTSLPNSKLKLSIPLMKINHGTEHTSFFVQPHYFVDQSFEDFLTRTDTPLWFTRKLFTNERN